MGWRKDLRKRRKLARVRKKELYVTDEQYRKAKDERKSKIIQSAINVGTSVAGAFTGSAGGGIGAALNALRAQNDLGESPKTRDERLKVDSKLRGYNNITLEQENGTKQNTTLYIAAAAAVAVLFFVGK
jgi:hypothetical protein